jgi:hypothetical protein
MRSNSFTSQAAAGLLAAALVAAPLAAETARAAEPAPQAGSVTASAGTPHQLHVVILDGEGALNNIKERTAREPIVQIQDENHKPVSEAAVVFLIQGNGGSSAGGAFANGLTSFTTTTGADGIAKAPGLAPNGVAGSFTIVVTATVAGITATSLIHQVNVAGGGIHPVKLLQQQSVLHPHLIAITGVVAGVAAVATVVAVTSTGTSPTSIVTGSTTVGAPTAGVSGFKVRFGRH